MNQLQKQADALYEKWNRIDAIYSEHAKGLNLSHTSVDVLYFMYKSQDNESMQCTQKTICEEYDFPKQTVNTIISGFIKDGLVEFGEAPEDRRHKTLLLTEKGKAFCADIFEKIQQAETRAFAKIPEEERAMLLSLLDKYANELRQELLNKI